MAEAELAKPKGTTSIDPDSGALKWEPREHHTEQRRTYTQSCGCIPDLRHTRPLQWLKDNKLELLAGVTTGLTAVPTAVAFAILANLSPAIGLRGTWLIMLIMAVFGGRPGMIYSNSGSMGVILETLNADRPVGYMFYAFLLAGIIQVVIGFGRVAKLLRLMPQSVMIGFVNGLAIVLLLAQVKNFQRGTAFGDSPSPSRRLAETSFSVFSNGAEWIVGAELGYMFIVIICTMLTIVLAGRYIKLVPPILLGVVVATGVEWALIRGIIGSRTNVLSDVAEISGELPRLIWNDPQFSADLPPLNSETLSVVIGPAISLLAVGLVESLMTVRLVNEITATPSNVHQEAIWGGVGNFVAAALGGQGGNSEIGLTMVNLKSGGRNRVAGVTSAVLVLVIVLAAYPVINLVPMAGLVGVMVVIAFNTFDWSSLPKIAASVAPRSWRQGALRAPAKASENLGTVRPTPGLRQAPLVTTTESVAQQQGGEEDSKSSDLPHATTAATSAVHGSTAAVSSSSSSSGSGSSGSKHKGGSARQQQQQQRDKRKQDLALQAISKADALIIIAVTVITPFTNLAISVGVGIGLALLTYTWQSGYRVSAKSYTRPGVELTDPAVIKVYDVSGPLFFASADFFLELFDHWNDPPLVELHFHAASICDYSAIQALNTLGERYRASGRTLRLRAITGESHKVISRGTRLLHEDISVDLSEETFRTEPVQWLHRAKAAEGMRSTAGARALRSPQRTGASSAEGVRRQTIDFGTLHTLQAEPGNTGSSSSGSGSYKGRAAVTAAEAGETAGSHSDHGAANGQTAALRHRSRLMRSASDDLDSVV